MQKYLSKLLKKIIVEETISSKLSPQMKKSLKNFNSELEDIARYKTPITYQYAVETIKNFESDFPTDIGIKIAKYMKNKLNITAKKHLNYH